MTEPQAAYAGYSFGMKAKWNFLQRTIPHTGDLFKPLEELLSSTFITNLTGHVHSPIEREIMALPARNGGLGIPNPVLTAEPSFLDSMKITEELSSLIKEQKWECPKEETMKKAKHEVVKHKRESEKKNLVSIKDKIKTEIRDSKKKPQLLTAREMATLKGASSWLTALPLQDQNFALNKAEFRDALAFGTDGDPRIFPKGAHVERSTRSRTVWTVSSAAT